jgi:hypothetical protein
VYFKDSLPKRHSKKRCSMNVLLKTERNDLLRGAFDEY